MGPRLPAEHGASEQRGEHQPDAEHAELGHHLERVLADPALAPPGWYLLFILNAARHPSAERWIRVTS